MNIDPIKRIATQGIASGAIAAVALGLPLAFSAALYGESTLPTASGRFQVTLRGRAGGSTSIPAAISRTPEDAQGNLCLGYATLDPSHTLEVTEPLSQVRFRVDSGGNDTVLVIYNPSTNFLLCGDDIDRRNRDSQARSPKMVTGTYRIWVGTFEPNQTYDYILNIDSLGPTQSALPLGKHPPF